MISHYSQFILKPGVQNFILGVICFNALCLGLETCQFAQGSFGTFLTVADHVCLAIFVVEILCKICALGLKGFFKDGWNIFDFFIVAVCLVPSSGLFSVLRSLRIFRATRLIARIPQLRFIVQTLFRALPSIGWIFALMAIIFYIFAVMATKLFGEQFPQWFGTMGETLYTLFQMVTLESWSMGIARPVMEVYPYAVYFFVPFILIGSFIVINMFISVLINSMSEAKDETLADEKSKEQLQLQTLTDEVRQLRAQIKSLETALKKR